MKTLVTTSFLVCFAVSFALAGPPHCATGTCYKPAAVYAPAYVPPAYAPASYSTTYNYQTPVVVVGVPVPYAYERPIALQGRTQYGYTSVAQAYGELDSALLFDKAARLAEQAQGLGQQATSDFVTLVQSDRDRRQEAARILAAAQAVREVLDSSNSAPQGDGDIKLETRRTTVKTSPRSSIRLKGKALTSATAVLKARCVSCHQDYNDWDSLDDEVRLAIFERVNSPNPTERMPKKGDGKTEGDPLPTSEKLLLHPSLTK